jgi:ATP-dependent exoDNAse (exonuclease V) alpha subunit
VLHVNFSYLVHAVCADGLVLDDLEKNFSFVPTKLLHHFSFAHALTGHSLQGLSIDGAVTVFDAAFSWVIDGQVCGVTPHWMYTALTRVRDLNKLYMFEGQLPAVAKSSKKKRTRKRLYARASP